MKQLDEELRMSMGADDHHVDAMDDEAVDREVSANLMRSLRAEDKVNPGPTKLLLEEARKGAAESSRKR